MTVQRQLAPGEYYHVFNRGAHKQGIFKDHSDWVRFLFGLLYFQSPVALPRVSRMVSGFSRETGFPVEEGVIEEILKNRLVEVTAFSLMPNHFHFLLRQVNEDGISRYMQRVSDAYTKYFNTKYTGSGHVFQGRYKTVHVKDDRQLMHLSAYIHRNPRELAAWRGKEFEYPWSSLQDYTGANRWGGLLATDIIASRFAATPNSNYADFVRTSPAKMLEEEFGYSEKE